MGPGGASGSGNLGGAGGAVDAGGAGGAGGAGSVACETLIQTSAQGLDHDHIPNDATAKATLFAAFEAQVHGATPKMAFTLFTELNHTHTITLTDGEVATLLSGGTVTGNVSSIPVGTVDPQGHKHTYTITLCQ
jgi:hypothetical protein